MAENRFKYKLVRDEVNETTYEVNVDAILYSEVKEKTLKELSKDVTIAGFRPGKAPREAIEARLGSKLVTESLGNLLPKVAYEVVVKENLSPMTQLDYKVMKIGENGSVDFTFTFTSYPKVKLGDFKKIKVTKEKIKTNDDEINLVIRNMIMTSLPKEKWEKKSPATRGTKPSKVAKTNKGKVMPKDKKNVKRDSQEEVPDFELSDELVKELNFEGVATLEDMRLKVKERLVGIKDQQAEDKYIGDVIESLVEISEVPVPDVFLKKEEERIEHSFTDRLKQVNLEPEIYFQTQGTTFDKKKEEWKKEALEHVKTELVLLQVALDNKTLPTDEEVDKEINAIEDAATREGYNTQKGRDYIRSILTKQKAIKKLLELVEKK